KRVVPAEVTQDLRQPGERQVVGDADAQPAARPGPAEVGRRLLAGAEDVAREPDHRLAVGGERHGMRVALHERPADLPLQTADVLADRGLLYAEPRRRPGEAPGLLDGQERREELRV